MNSTEFLSILKTQTSTAALNSTISILLEPPGEQPSAGEIELSTWYKDMNATEQARMRAVIRQATEQAIFNFLTLLDGVTAIENTPEKGRLELFYVGAGKRTLLNAPTNEELHNQFGDVLDISTEEPVAEPYAVGEARDLLAILRVGDGLDLHRVPRKSVGLESLENYDPDTAPAILLPKGEHLRVSPDGLSSLE